MKRNPARHVHQVDLTEQEGVPGPRSEVRLELKPFHLVLSSSGPDGSQASRILAVSIATMVLSASAALLGFMGHLLALPAAAVVTLMAVGLVGALIVVLMALRQPRSAPEDPKGQSG